MLDRVVQPVNVGNKRSRQTLQPYQSVWFAHWKPTTCDAAEETCNSEASGRKELDNVTGNDHFTKGLEDSSRSVEELGMIKATTFEVSDDIFKKSSKSIGNERMLGALCKNGQDTNYMHALKPDFSRHLKHGKAVDCESGVQLPSLLDKGKAAGSSLNACLRESIPCDHYLPSFYWNMLPKMQTGSGVRLFPSQCISSEESGTKKSHNECYTLLRMQNCVHDVETVRIFTTNGLLITKQTDVNAVIENDMFGSTRAVSKVNGNITSGLHCEWPFLGQGKPQVILQPLNSLSDSQVKENITDVKTCNVTIKSASSDEIATMEMDSFKKNSMKNLHSGLNSTTSIKAFNLEPNIPPWSLVASSTEVGNGQLNNNPRDMNLKFPALPSAANSSETQSLDRNKLLKHVEQSKLKSKFNLNDFPNADTGNKWVKRLKLTSSNSFSHRTKSSNFTSNNLFSSEPTLEEQGVKRSDKNWDILKKDEDQLMENPKDKGKALLLSHAWIQRWLHNGRGETEAKPETNVVREPRSSKLTTEKLHKEQLPSLAAMALMAKVLTCFQPCELQKRGPFTIWNTKTF